LAERGFRRKREKKLNTCSRQDGPRQHAGRTILVSKKTIMRKEGNVRGPPQVLRNALLLKEKPVHKARIRGGELSEKRRSTPAHAKRLRVKWESRSRTDRRGGGLSKLKGERVLGARHRKYSEKKELEELGRRTSLRLEKPCFFEEEGFVKSLKKRNPKSVRPRKKGGNASKANSLGGTRGGQAAFRENTKNKRKEKNSLGGKKEGNFSFDKKKTICGGKPSYVRGEGRSLADFQINGGA